MDRLGELIDYRHIAVVLNSGASMSSIENFPVTQWKTVVTTKNYKASDRLVASQIVGDSLSGDRIFEGDWAILRLNFETSEISNGDICAVLTPYGCLLKHVYLTLDDKVRLVSSNPEFNDILLDIDQVEIQGILEEIIISFR